MNMLHGIFLLPPHKFTKFFLQYEGIAPKIKFALKINFIPNINFAPKIIFTPQIYIALKLTALKMYGVATTLKQMFCGREFFFLYILEF